MLFLKHALVYEARTATPSDTEAVQQLIARAWRVHLRVPLEQVPLRLRSGSGWVAGEGNKLSGFMLAEMQPFLTEQLALITGAALSDDWRVSAYLNTFLPPVENMVRQEGASALVQIGYAPWLTTALGERGFLSRDWVVTYEWYSQPVTVRGNRSVTIRSAHLRDLPTLLDLDRHIFGPIWHKPTSSFEEALARAFIFSVAEQNGEIVGYQWCEAHDRHGHITRLAVRSDREGQGIGTRLLAETLAALLEAGMSWITLNTQESNLRSQMLYERHGFRRTGERVAVLWKDM
jgi:ribosomal-protein-alanine N-acetyltransferase